MLTMTHMLWQEYVMTMERHMHCMPSLYIGDFQTVKRHGKLTVATVTFMTST